MNLAPNFAVLRSEPSEADIYLLMDYGPHGGTHGHPDRLNIIFYANGRLQAPDFGNLCDYRLPLWREWDQQTISHNTVVVNEESQYTGARLNFFQVSPRAKIADASPVTDAWSYDVPSQAGMRCLFSVPVGNSGLNFRRRASGVAGSSRGRAGQKLIVKTGSEGRSGRALLIDGEPWDKLLQSLWHLSHIRTADFSIG